MDEELLQAVRAALTRPDNRWTTEQANAYLAENTTYGSVEELQASVSAATQVDRFSNFQSALAGVGSGASFGFLDELTGLALSSDIGATALGRPDLKGLSRDDATRLARESQGRAISENPLAFGAGGIAGAAGPGSIVGRAIGVGGGGSGILGNVGRGDTVRGAIGGAAARGAATGGTEGLLFGLGAGEGDLAERADQAIVGATLGAGTGGVIGALAGAPAALRVVQERIGTRGPRGRAAVRGATELAAPEFQIVESASLRRAAENATDPRQAAALRQRAKDIDNLSNKGKRGFASSAEDVDADLQVIGQEQGQFGVESYRTGMFRAIEDKLRGSGAREFIQDMVGNPDTQAKLRVVAGSDDRFAELMGFVRAESGRIRGERIADLAADLIGFLGGGSSLVGKVGREAAGF